MEVPSELPRMDSETVSEPEMKVAQDDGVEDKSTWNAFKAFLCNAFKRLDAGLFHM